MCSVHIKIPGLNTVSFSELALHMPLSFYTYQDSPTLLQENLNPVLCFENRKHYSTIQFSFGLYLKRLIYQTGIIATSRMSLHIKVSTSAIDKGLYGTIYV